VKAIGRYHADVKAATTDVAADQLLERMATRSWPSSSPLDDDRLMTAAVALPDDATEIRGARRGA
jgi:hypothetical protein